MYRLDITRPWMRTNAGSPAEPRPARLYIRRPLTVVHSLCSGEGEHSPKSRKNSGTLETYGSVGDEVGTAVNRSARPRYAFSRSRAKNDSPVLCSLASSLRVQSQSEHAHGSLPFRSRQFRRACASLTLTKSKYSSQYGRSS